MTLIDREHILLDDLRVEVKRLADEIAELNDHLECHDADPEATTPDEYR